MATALPEPIVLDPKNLVYNEDLDEETSIDPEDRLPGTHANLVLATRDPDHPWNLEAIGLMGLPRPLFPLDDHYQRRRLRILTVSQFDLLQDYAFSYRETMYDDRLALLWYHIRDVADDDRARLHGCDCEKFLRLPQRPEPPHDLLDGHERDYEAVFTALEDFTLEVTPKGDVIYRSTHRLPPFFPLEEEHEDLRTSHPQAVPATLQEFLDMPLSSVPDLVELAQAVHRHHFIEQTTKIRFPAAYIRKAAARWRRVLRKEGLQ